MHRSVGSSRSSVRLSGPEGRHILCRGREAPVPKRAWWQRPAGPTHPSGNTRSNTIPGISGIECVGPPGLRLSWLPNTGGSRHRQRMCRAFSPPTVLVAHHRWLAPPAEDVPGLQPSYCLARPSPVARATGRGCAGPSALLIGRSLESSAGPIARIIRRSAGWAQRSRTLAVGSPQC